MLNKVKRSLLTTNDFMTLIAINAKKEPKQEDKIRFLLVTILLLILCQSFGVIFRQLTLSFGALTWGYNREAAPC